MISVISDNPRTFFRNLKQYEKQGLKGLHFDVMDGVFVPRLGLFPELLKEIRQISNIFVEVHVMLTKPSKFIQAFSQAGADRMIFHVESDENMENLINLSQEEGMSVGVAINPSTSISSIIPHLGKIQSVMLMAINPGIPKHPLIETTYNRLQDLRALVNNSAPNVEIEIDGGVTFANFEKLIDQGADVLICGSGTVFQPTDSLDNNLSRLLKSFD